MDLYEISKDLAAKPLKLIVNRQENTEISGVRLYLPESTRINPDFLYVLPYSLLLTLNISGNFACILDCPEQAAAMDMPHSNLIAVNENYTSEALYKELEAILADGKQFEIYSKSLHRMLAENKGIKEIFDAAYGFSGNPITFETINGKILYYTKDEKLDDIVTQEMLQTEAEIVPGWFLSSYHEGTKNRSIEKVNKGSYPEYIDLTEVYSLIILGAFIDNKVAAYVSMYESDHKFTRIDYKLLSLLGDIASYLLQKWEFSCDSDFLLNNLVNDILDQHIHAPLIIEDRVKSAQLEPKDNIYVMVISVHKDERDNILLPYILKRIKGILKEDNIVIYRDSIVVIITRNKENPLQKNELTEFTAFLKKNRLYAGISHFEKFRDLYKHYLQALKYLKIGQYFREENTVYSYEEYGIYQIMDMCSAAEDILNFCHPSMIDLFVYDKKNKTNLALTLYTYLKNMFNQLETSNELKVHRATLARHINHIKQITNLDLNDENLSFHLKLTYKILEYIGYTKDNRISARENH